MSLQSIRKLRYKFNLALLLHRSAISCRNTLLLPLCASSSIGHTILLSKIYTAFSASLIYKSRSSLYFASEYPVNFSFHFSKNYRVPSYTSFLSFSDTAATSARLSLSSIRIQSLTHDSYQRL